MYHLIKINMNKILLSVAALFATISLSAQVSIAEPDFSEQVIVVKSDMEGVLLNKESAQLKTKAGASVYIVGIGSQRTRMTLSGTEASQRFAPGRLRMIVRAVDNKTDPLSIIAVIKLEQTKKDRRAEMAKFSTFGGASSNNEETVVFNAKAYGEASYLLVIDDIQPGEYAVTVSNPNQRDEKNSLMVATFGIDNVSVSNDEAVDEADEPDDESGTSGDDEIEQESVSTGESSVSDD